MADDDGIEVMSESDGDDDQCDTLPPTKKCYRQSRLPFSVSASIDREGDGEASGSTSTRVRGIDPDRHVTAACGSNCCAGGLTPFLPTDTTILDKLRKKQGDQYRCFSSSWYSAFPWLTVCVT